TRKPLNFATRRGSNISGGSGWKTEWFLGIKEHNSNEGRIHVLVVWEDGQCTWEPLADFAKEADREVRSYAILNNLQHCKGWRFVLRQKPHPVCTYDLEGKEGAIL
ncbi:MAG: hypothetical protein ACRCZI_14620, partial [Cetobacterium sp.]